MAVDKKCQSEGEITLAEKHEKKKRENKKLMSSLICSIKEHITLPAFLPV